jgi:4-amino-4-deoxy-L-arabinose transferase-like glycosyltransferase
VLFATIVFVLVIAIRIRLLGIPLERDEGEYAYAGQLMLQGIPPYKLAYNMKFPGTYAAYAGIMWIFGQTISGIHLGLLLVNAASIVLIFFLGRRLVNSTAGIAAAIAYAILSLSPSVFGLAAHATHFVMLPVLGGTLLLLKQSDRKAIVSLFASGLLFGIGLLMKQPAFSYVLFGAIYLVLNDIRRRVGLRVILLRALIFGGGAILPFGITCLVLWSAGVFDKFWFWTIDYAQQYATLVPLRQALQMFADNVAKVIGAGWTLWLLAGFGLLAGVWHKATRVSTRFLLGLFAASALALSSTLYFREHYFILVLPAVSLLVGVAISTLIARVTSHTGIARFVPLLVLAAAVCLPVIVGEKLFFRASPVEACRMLYDLNPFPESIRIAEYARNHTDPNDTIGVLGSEPQIYFYSNRHSATGYIYAYSLMELQSYALPMQQEAIREIELTRPKYLIAIHITSSWLKHPGSEGLILRWINEYLKEHYDEVGAVNIVSTDRTDYYFGEQPKLVSQPVNYILIYQRKT